MKIRTFLDHFFVFLSVFFFGGEGLFRVIRSCSLEILCNRSFSGRCCFSAICKKEKKITSGFLMGPGDFGAWIFSSRGLQLSGLGARVIAGCGCVWDF